MEILQQGGPYNVQHKKHTGMKHIYLGTYTMYTPVRMNGGLSRGLWWF